jgi:hypothetical protein
MQRLVNQLGADPVAAARLASRVYGFNGEEDGYLFSPQPQPPLGREHELLHSDFGSRPSAMIEPHLRNQVETGMRQAGVDFSRDAAYQDAANQVLNDHLKFLPPPNYSLTADRFNAGSGPGESFFSAPIRSYVTPGFGNAVYPNAPPITQPTMNLGLGHEDYEARFPAQMTSPAGAAYHEFEHMDQPRNLGDNFNRGGDVRATRWAAEIPAVLNEVAGNAQVTRKLTGAPLDTPLNLSNDYQPSPEFIRRMAAQYGVVPKSAPIDRANGGPGVPVNPAHQTMTQALAAPRGQAWFGGLLKGQTPPSQPEQSNHYDPEPVREPKVPLPPKSPTTMPLPPVPSSQPAKQAMATDLGSFAHATYAQLPGFHPYDAALGAAAGAVGGEVYHELRGKGKHHSRLGDILGGAAIGGGAADVVGDRGRRYFSNLPDVVGYDAAHIVGTAKARGLHDLWQGGIKDQPIISDVISRNWWNDPFATMRRELMRRAMGVHTDTPATDYFQPTGAVRTADGRTFNRIQLSERFTDPVTGGPPNDLQIKGGSDPIKRADGIDDLATEINALHYVDDDPAMPPVAPAVAAPVVAAPRPQPQVAPLPAVAAVPRPRPATTTQPAAPAAPTAPVQTAAARSVASFAKAPKMTSN